MIVMKFGGTSNQDGAAMKNVAKIVASRRDRSPLVVISAIAKGTNMLEQAGKLAAEGSLAGARSVLKDLFARHYAILDENVGKPADHAALKSFLDQSLASLEELARGVSILRELTPRTMDAFCSFGELMSSRLVWATMKSAGIDAEWLDTKDFMVTDEHFNSAAPIMDVVVERLGRLVHPGIARGVVYVTQGFIGVTGRGDRTTMGRESSDYSAAVIGGALNAEDVQIWTDVDGILTGDPALVTMPRKVKEMSFQEAYEVSFFGAKVLHPSTMLPALEKNIPIHIFNSHRPQLSGTKVTAGAPGEKHVVKSVASRDRIALLRVQPVKRFSPYIFWEHVFNVLTRHDAITRMTATSEYGISIALDDRNYMEAIVRDLESLGKVECERGKGIIALVGTRMTDEPELLRRIFDAAAGIDVRMVSFGASNSSIGFVVASEAVEDLVRTLHREFFEGARIDGVFETLEHSQG